MTMRGAPLIEARVRQYEQSADGHLIVDTHPEAANAWIAGGGSGHGYQFRPYAGSPDSHASRRWACCGS